MRVAKVACALKDRIETTVVLPNDNSERFREQLDKCNILYKALSITRLSKQLSVLLKYALFSIVEIIRLTAYFKNNGFDLVHVSGGAWQYKGLIAGKIAGCKVVWHLNDSKSPLPIRWFFSLLSRLPDYYIYSSNRTREYYSPLIKSISKSGMVIRPPVDTAYYSLECDDSGNILKQNYKYKYVIGTIANINPIKNIEMLIRIASKVTREHKNTVFLIVGTISKHQEPYYQSLLKLIEEFELINIVFTGAIDNVKPYLEIMDIYLCTSLHETGPMTLWEAMSMEKPVITTDVGDVKDFVKNGVSGEVVAVDDINRMSEKVVMLLDDENVRMTYGKNARKAAVTGLDIKVCADLHYDAYLQAIS